MLSGYSIADDDDDVKYHLYWKIYGSLNKLISGYALSGELFAFLGFGDLKANLLRIISGSEESDVSPLNRVFLNGQLLNGGLKSFNGFSSTTNGKKSSSEVSLKAQQKSCLHSILTGSLVPLIGNTNSYNYNNFALLDSSQEELCLFEDLTVIEMLIFSCELRNTFSRNQQPSELLALRLLSDAGLENISDSRMRALSLWQKRMVLFAIEVVAGKDILFFNRPTADLDAPSALSLISAMQRIARTGHLVMITADSLTFREYAILDRIQLLTMDSSIYFGPGSAAMSHFAQFNYTPSPGASTSDFLYDMAEDVACGYVDVAGLEKAAEELSHTISYNFEKVKRKSLLARQRRRQSESYGNINSNNYNTAQSRGDAGTDTISDFFTTGYRTSSGWRLCDSSDNSETGSGVFSGYDESEIEEGDEGDMEYPAGREALFLFNNRRSNREKRNDIENRLTMNRDIYSDDSNISRGYAAAVSTSGRRSSSSRGSGRLCRQLPQLSQVSNSSFSFSSSDSLIPQRVPFAPSSLMNQSIALTLGQNGRLGKDRKEGVYGTNVTHEKKRGSVRTGRQQRGKVKLLFVSLLSRSKRFIKRCGRRVVSCWEWLVNFECLQTDEDACPRQPLLVKQFSWCLWRAFVLRIRNSDQILGIYFVTGLLTCMVIFLAFSGRSTNQQTSQQVGCSVRYDEQLQSYLISDESGGLCIDHKVTFLSILPLIIITAATLSDDVSKERFVFAFERSRGYYLALYFPVTSILADIAVCRALPSVFFGSLVYWPLGLRPSLAHFLTFISVISIMSMVGTVMTKAVNNVLVATPTFIASKAPIVMFLVNVTQLLHAGMFLARWRSGNVSAATKIMMNCSIYFWGCNVLYWNEYDDVNLTRSDDLPPSLHASFNPWDALNHLVLLGLSYFIIAIAASLLLHREKPVRCIRRLETCLTQRSRLPIGDLCQLLLGYVQQREQRQ